MVIHLGQQSKIKCIFEGLHICNCLFWKIWKESASMCQKQTANKGCKI